MEFNIEQKIHIALMYKITKEISQMPLILKGGTGLLLGYGLNRFSEDLDYDAAKKFNLESKLKNIKLLNYKILEVVHKKDNSKTSDKYFLYYDYNSKNIKISKQLLKLDISYRAIYNNIKYNIIDGIKIQDLSSILDTKISIALDNKNVNKIRGKFRDLFDINFIIHNYPNILTNDNLIRIYNCINNSEKIIADFKLNFKEDKRFNKYPTLLEDIYLELYDMIENLYNQKIKITNLNDNFIKQNISLFKNLEIEKIKETINQNLNLNF